MLRRNDAICMPGNKGSKTDKLLIKKIENNSPVPAAFTKVKITRALDLLRQHPDWTSTYRAMDKWRNEEGFLLQSEFRQWMESVVNKALNKLDRQEPNCYTLKIKDTNTSGRESEYIVSLKKSGPALTFNIVIVADNAKMDVDFVPVIEFTYPMWPPQHVRRLDDQLIKATKTSWFIVPKPGKTEKPDHTLWRLAFHEQEREMINGKVSLKPVCRLLKKLRDSRGLNVASYYLKTLFLWQIDENDDPGFWKMKQAPLFIHMLKVLEKSLSCGKILYYWDKRYNLIESYQDSNKQNLACRLRNIIKDIEKMASGSPIETARHILSREEFVDFQRKYSKDVSAALTEQMPTCSSRSSNRDTVCTADRQEFISRPNGNCPACETVLSQLADLKKSLSALSNKVDILERQFSRLHKDEAHH